MVNTYADLIGRTIAKVNRIFYIQNGLITGRDGALQIDFSDDSVVLFEGASDGESLVLKPNSWLDPFEGTLDEQTQIYIATHGKLCSLDLSEEYPYKDLIGIKILGYCLLQNEFSKICGIRIQTSAKILEFIIEGDEEHLYWICSGPS